MNAATLLVVEDNQDLNALVTEFFQTEGYTVHSALTGEDGIAISRAHRIDLVLLDIRLPDIDGYAVFAKLREHQPTQRTPVILLTERRDRSTRLQGLEMGVVDYITKPFDVHELRLRVRNALSRSLLRKSANPVTELPLALETEHKLKEVTASGKDWAVIQLSLGSLDRFRTEYGFIAGADLLRAVAITLRSVLRDLELSDCYAGHMTTEDVAIVLPPARAATALSELSGRLADMLPRFLPPKAREQTERPVKIQIAHTDHGNSAVTDVITLKDALTSRLQPIPY
ncbi:MAG: response regulator [Anaerolineae bacterium]|nr:response regulator [Chloroflexota bacterium]MBP6297879.1 response regulator [Anaerolineae bacterium]